MENIDDILKSKNYSPKEHEKNYKKLHDSGLDELFILTRLDQGFEIRESPKGTLFAIKNIRFDNTENVNLISVTADLAGDLTEAKNYLKKYMKLIIKNLEKNHKCYLKDLE